MNNEKKRIIRSKLLEKYTKIKHGFGTRHVGVPLKDVLIPHQVHGNRVVWVDDSRTYESDGLITDKKGITIGVRTADCVPVLLYEPVKRIISVLHAGWMGTAAGIAKRAVAMAVNYGGSAKRLVAVIGPHIGPCCYRVNRSRMDAIKQMASIDNTVLQRRNGKAYLDLGKMNKQQLIDAGVADRHIDVLSYCTFCDEELFYSHRREGELRNNKHMINFIQLQ